MVRIAKNANKANKHKAGLPEDGETALNQSPGQAFDNNVGR